ncbi:MAG TPA: SUMF1/EgtB/PvdO family nonheme iron enzyme [Planctomycetaceae bacterium]|nr:SUMF1/EgtB/PvdO family nonheme iron enzyme [Planctomycetaceae bacterium]HQZ65218.1 SUMF1/EgtB/PvdO family nonheme iron enzyme [Planctomycetaceae bacterium]
MPDSHDSRSEHERQLDAIINQYYEAVEQGDPPNQDAFIAEHPEFAAELREFFSDARLLEGAALHEATDSATYISRNAIGVEYKGRYRLDRILGEGAFGRVYLGYDEVIKRQVAIKVPSKERFKKPEDAEAYLTEARIVASLDHSHIVPVFDVGRTEDGSIYVVSQFIEGITLADRIKAGSLEERDAAQLLATVARALQHAHDRRLIHRDVKPANILLQTQTGKVYVTDFGLAIREHDYLQQNIIAGTAAYMSPEQARGEGHRLDGRSDIFSMGIILYEILTGKKPFRGSSPMETLHEVISKELKRPREIRESIPVALERICLKALSKLTSDRYAKAAEFADDLEHWLQPTTAGNKKQVVAQVVPKGLRSFDAGDADFFLDLLPGPRNRDGLPEGIAFWKQRIEQSDPEQTFNVGLIYGPSGCGKSSLVKAGLLPHLSQDVVAIYVEATADDTEARILRGLRKMLPNVPESRGLADTLATLRRSQGRKVVIIIDQFEQWLHAHGAKAESELVRALRQCDGGRVQAIVMVRDDFSVAVSRFMRALDTRIVEGQNYALVDLFDIRHAVRVLTKFGQAFGKLPSNASDLSKNERAFVDEVVTGLALDSKVVPVRLSLFAEMVKSKPWTRATLQQVGDMAGVGVNFLDETFSSRQGNPDHRLHAVAARSVLRALLPELDTDIKGHMRSQADLLKASGYADRADDFAKLLRILDSELRLITPTDAEGETLGERQGVSPPSHSTGISGKSPRRSPPVTRFFQLTHDYLIPSLRDWLTRKQRETRRGRAELKLQERAAEWIAKPNNRHFPSLAEWIHIRAFTESRNWTDAQRIMMPKAARFHQAQWGARLSLTLVMGIVISLWMYNRQLTVMRERVRTAVDAAQNVRGTAVPFTIRDLHEKYPADLCIRELTSRFAAENDAARKLGLAFAIASFGTVDADFLVSQVDHVTLDDTTNLYEALAADRDAAVIALKTAAAASSREENWRRKARLATLLLYLGDQNTAADMSQFENRPDPVQRTMFIDEFPNWRINVNPVAAAIKSSGDSGLRSAICLAGGQIPATQVTAEEKQAWQTLASEWYLSHSDTSTHSAAAWLLRMWQVELPKTPTGPESQPEKKWFVNTVGMTMLEIPSGWFHQLAESNAENLNRDMTIAHSYWISDRETSDGQFLQFLEDPGCPTQEKPDYLQGAYARNSPTPDRPAQGVSWYEAIMYCNWLSQKERLVPCYERADEKNGSGGIQYDKWRLVPNSTGYRLPAEVEWEYACRAGTTTAFASGNSFELLSRYGQFNADSHLPVVCGTKLPNAWGLYDVHGNVYEWCEDRLYIGHAHRVLRGGSFYALGHLVRSGHRFNNVPESRNNDFGFRVARSMPLDRDSGLEPLPLRGGTVSLLPANRKSALTNVMHSPSGEYVFFCGKDNLCTLFNLRTKLEERAFHGHSMPVYTLTVSPDGETVVTGSEDRTLRFWDVKTGLQKSVHPAGGVFSCVRFSADGEFVFATNWDKMVRIWKRPFDQRPAEFPLDVSTLDIALLPDGKRFVVGLFSGEVLLCDIESRKVQERFTGHAERVHSVAVVNAGQQILSASYDHTLKLWNVGKTEPEHTFRGHTGVVNEVRVLPDGKRFVSCSVDGTIRLWDLHSGKELTRGTSGRDIRGLSVAPDGKSCVTAGMDGTLRQWELPDLISPDLP